MNATAKSDRNEAQQGGSEPLFSLLDVSKAYDGRRILNGISMAFPAGVFAVTGPNGCGKTTLLAVMAGIVSPDRGQITVAGHGFRDTSLAAKRSTAYLPDEPCIYPFLKGAEFLDLVAAVRGQGDLNAHGDMISAFGLRPHLDTRFSAMSLGTKRKFMLVSVLMHACPLLLLDEPSNALDVRSREYLVHALRLCRQHSCVILADHDELMLQEVSATRLRLDQGQLRTTS